MLRGLSAGLGLLAVFIDVNSVTVQSHATELNSSTVYCVIAGHNHSLLLFHHTALKAWGTALFGSAGRVCRRGEAGGSRGSCGHSCGINTTANGACGGGGRSGGGCIGDLFEVRLSQVVLRRVNGGGRNGRDHGMSGLGDGCLLGGSGRRHRCGSGGGGRWLGDRLGGLLGDGNRRSGFGLLLHRRSRWFGKKTRPPLLCALRNHTALRLGRLPFGFSCGLCISLLCLRCSPLGCDSNNSSRRRSLYSSGYCARSICSRSSASATATASVCANTSTTLYSTATTGSTSRSCSRLGRGTRGLLGLRASPVCGLLLDLTPLRYITCKASQSRSSNHKVRLISSRGDWG